MSARPPLAWLRSLGLVVALLVLGASVMTFRALKLGEAALVRAEAAFDRGDLRETIREARRSASLVVPGADHVERAFARLLVVARGAEAAGDLDSARLAWEAVRSAALEGQPAFGAPSDHLSRANRNLARLGARQVVERSPGDAAALERALERDLSRPATRSGLWSLLLGSGLVLSAAGVAWAALRGVRRDGSLSRRELLLGVALGVAGAVCWALAVYRA
jgi:ATP/maltotriose-dependent transcriptional regulator MalT